MVMAMMQVQDTMGRQKKCMQVSLWLRNAYAGVYVCVCARGGVEVWRRAIQRRLPDLTILQLYWGK